MTYSHPPIKSAPISAKVAPAPIVFPPSKHIHMIGIGGCGMSPLAHLLHHEGHIITGSDIHNSPTIDFLRQEGIHIVIGHAAANVGAPDVVVYSSAIGLDNPERVYALESAIPIIPRSALLASLMRLKHGIVVAGSHGKTSTTGLIFWALHRLGQDPSTVFGGKFNHEHISARFGDGVFMVVESDESDGSFLNLSPTIALITNIDHEHTAQYGSFENLVNAFEAFASQPPFYGFTVISADCPHTRKIRGVLKHRVLTFGLSVDADFSADFNKLQWMNPAADAATAAAHCPSESVTVLEKGAPPNEVVFKARAHHELRNMLGAYAVLRGIGFGQKELCACFQAFPGINRRMEILSETSSACVISDYAHHPTELKATLESVTRAYPAARAPLTLVFQPHRYSRFVDHHAQFADILAEAPRLIILPVYAAGEAMPESFPSLWDQWITAIRQTQNNVRVINQAEPPFTELMAALGDCAQPPATILFCGAGNVHLAAQICAAAAERRSAPHHDSLTL